MTAAGRRVGSRWPAEEAFEIVRRHLFASLKGKLAMESLGRAFADFRTASRDDFPQQTQESQDCERLAHAYPIHPEVFDQFYEDWSTLDNFQRTRSAEDDGEGHPPAVEGWQQPPADHVGQPVAVRRRPTRPGHPLPAAGLGAGDGERTADQRVGAGSAREDAEGLVTER